jgi:hypothetical protein
MVATGMENSRQHRNFMSSAQAVGMGEIPTFVVGTLSRWLVEVEWCGAGNATQRA